MEETEYRAGVSVLSYSGKHFTLGFPKIYKTKKAAIKDMKIFIDDGVTIFIESRTVSDWQKVAAGNDQT